MTEKSNKSSNCSLTFNKIDMKKTLLECLAIVATRLWAAIHSFNNIDKIKTLLECLAIVATGFWAVIHFGLIELNSLKTDFNGSSALTLNKWDENKKRCIFDFSVKVKNDGKSTRKLEEIEYTICKLAPAKNLQKTAGAQEIPDECEPNTETAVTPTIDYIMRRDGEKKQRNYGEVYPGEEKTTIYSFSVPESDWPWRAQATGFQSRSRNEILFKTSDWKFCTEPNTGQ